MLENNKGEVSTYEFDLNRGIFTYTDFSNRKLTTYYFMRYDVAYNGKVRQVVDSQERVVANYRYNKDSGKIIRFRDLAKNDLNFKYDANGNLIQITKRAANSDEVLPVRSFSYDKTKPNKINELDANGNIVRTTIVKYDAQLRPIFIDNGQNSLKILYNANGFPSKIVDSFGIETEYKYDKYNRKISQSRNGIEYLVEYKNDLIVKSYTKFNSEILKTISFTYDKNGKVKSYKDQDGLEKKFTRDEEGRILNEIFPDNREVKYSYDELGNLSKVIDQNGNEIKFEWNKYGLNSHITAVGQINKNYYDKYGRLISRESKFENKEADRTFDYTFDELDRVIKIYCGINEERLKYDSWGKVVEKSKNGLTSKFKYDHFDRLVEKVEGNSITKYTYDNFGNRLSRITTKAGVILDEYNTYDKFGRLTKTKSNGKVLEYIYNDNNQLSEQIIDGNIVKFEYTKLGQVASKTLYSKDGKVITKLKYFYDKSGKIISRFANGKLHSYKYDAKNQLLSVTDLETQELLEEYVYDPTGNILQKTILGKTTTYTYDEANQLVSSISPDGKETNYAYDAAGRMIKEGDKIYKYAWLDKVVQVSENGKTIANFEYHNNGQIAKAIRGDNVETFEWDGLALIERSGTKYVNEPHIGGGNPVLAVAENTETIFTDILGTSLGKIEDGGYSAIDKTSFGADSSDKSSFFTGKPYVEELGYASLLRNYRSDIGKWLTQDLIGYPDGWNNLAYCGNMNTMTVDLYGAVWSWATSSIGAAVSAAGYVATCFITGESITTAGVVGAASGGFVAGAIVGALIGDPSAVSVTTLVGVGALSSAAGQLTNNIVSTALDSNQDFNYITLTDGVASSALIGGLTAGFASAIDIDGILGEMLSAEIGIASGVYDYMKNSLIDSLERIGESKKQQLLDFEAFYE